MMDVARLAGVSQPTVSFVLNDRRDVSVAEDTRRRVLEAARELNFRVNRTAQQLRGGKSFALGIVTDAIASAPYAGRTVRGIQEAVRDRGYVCMLVDTGGDPQIEEDGVKGLIDRGIAGVIYAPAHVQYVKPTAQLHEVPTVFVNCWPPKGFRGPIVVADEYNGGLAAATTVFSRGHRRVALLGGTHDEWAAIERKRGFVDAARKAGVTGRLRILDGDFSVDSGYELTRKVFRSRTSPPTALVMGNDRMAIGALLALHELSLRVSDDVSLVGYDDQQDIASQLRPRLTTVALPHYELGHTAGLLITDQDTPHPDGPLMINCPLIERDSVGPPPEH
jgi:LacI family transcriptional regulator